MFDFVGPLYPVEDYEFQGDTLPRIEWVPYLNHYLVIVVNGTLFPPDNPMWRLNPSGNAPLLVFPREWPIGPEFEFQGEELERPEWIAHLQDPELIALWNCMYYLPDYPSWTHRTISPNGLPVHIPAKKYPIAPPLCGQATEPMFNYQGTLVSGYDFPGYVNNGMGSYPDSGWIIDQWSPTNPPEWGGMPTLPPVWDWDWDPDWDLPWRDEWDRGEVEFDPDDDTGDYNGPGGITFYGGVQVVHAAIRELSADALPSQIMFRRWGANYGNMEILKAEEPYTVSKHGEVDMTFHYHGDTYIDANIPDSPLDYMGYSIVEQISFDSSSSLTPYDNYFSEDNQVTIGLEDGKSKKVIFWYEGNAVIDEDGDASETRVISVSGPDGIERLTLLDRLRGPFRVQTGEDEDARHSFATVPLDHRNASSVRVVTDKGTEALRKIRR